MSDDNTYVLTLSCVDRKGIVAGVANSLASQDCNIIESAQYFDPDSGCFFMRVCFTAPPSRPLARVREGFTPVATGFGLSWAMYDMAARPRVLIMVSKFGHCLNDLLYRHSVGQLRMELAGVVSNHDVMRSRVEAEGVPYHHMPVTKETKAEQEAALLALIERENVELVVLARYMQVLSDELSRKLEGRVINIHHSFLPSFKGARPYHHAHARGVKLVGATAHYVTPELDEGPIIEQDVQRVDHSMSAQRFIEMGRDVESRVLARAVGAHLEHRILLNGDKTVVFG